MRTLIPMQYDSMPWTHATHYSQLMIIFAMPTTGKTFGADGNIIVAPNGDELPIADVDNWTVDGFFGPAQAADAFTGTDFWNVLQHHELAAAYSRGGDLMAGLYMAESVGQLVLSNHPLDVTRQALSLRLGEGGFDINKTPYPLVIRENSDRVYELSKQRGDPEENAASLAAYNDYVLSSTLNSFERIYLLSDDQYLYPDVITDALDYLTTHSASTAIEETH